MIEHNITIGFSEKEELLKMLLQNGIELNEFAEQLIQRIEIIKSNEPITLVCIELKVNELGLTNGGTFLELEQAANKLNLYACPIETALYFRLIYKEPFSQDPYHLKQNLDSFLTVFSPIFSLDHNFPKGFYLRAGTDCYCLRGYRCDFEYIWPPGARILFCKL